MSFHTEKEGFPAVPLTSGMRIRLEAIDPTTGDPVANVRADRWAIYGEDQSEPVPVPDPPIEWVQIPLGD